MIKTSIEKIAESIGQDIGMSDDIVQGDLLNGFCKGIHNSIRDRTGRERQMCCIADKLTPTSEDVLIELVEFIKLNKEERKNK